MYKYLLNLFLLVLGAQSYGQTCDLTFSGKVEDYHNGEAMVNAALYIESLDIYAISDIDGAFIFNNLCPGRFTVTISHISCETQNIEIELTQNKVQTILMEHHIEELESVSVSGNVSKQQTLASQESVIKQSTIERFSAASLGDLVEQISGVSTITTGNKIVKPVIGGLHSSRIITVNNNVRMEDMEWGIEHAPNIDLNAAQNISVIKGSGTLAYGGDAIGGIVVLDPQKIVLNDTLYGKTITGFQSNGRGYHFNSSLSKIFNSGWFASGLIGYKQNGDLKAPDYFLNNTGSKGFSINAHGGFKSFEQGFDVYVSHIDNEIGILSASHIGNIEDLVNAINSQEPYVNEDFSNSILAPRQEVDHTLVKAAAYRRFKSFGKLSVQYDYQNNHRFEFDRRRDGDQEKPAVDLRLQTHSLKTDIKVDKYEDYVFDFGVSGRYQDNFANPETGVRRLIPDYERYDLGLYAIAKKDINHRFVGDLGIRYDYNHVDALKYYQTSRWEERGYDEDFGDIVIEDLGTQLLTNPTFTFHNFSLSAGLRYKINEINTLKLHYSHASRPPNPSELFSDGLHHSAARIQLGDLRIDKEISNRIGLTYALNTDRISMNLEPYYNRIDDFIYIRPTGAETTIRGSFPVWEYFQTDANLLGLDFSLDYTLTDRWNFNALASYVYGQNVTEDLPIIDMPAFKLNSAITYFHEGWHDLRINLNYKFVAEQNRYPDYNFETYIATRDTFELVDISTPPPAYNLFDLYADATFDISNKMSLNVLAGIENIFNTSYREYLNRLRYFADDTGRNITVQIKLNY